MFDVLAYLGEKGMVRILVAIHTREEQVTKEPFALIAETG